MTLYPLRTLLAAALMTCGAIAIADDPVVEDPVAEDPVVEDVVTEDEEELIYHAPPGSDGNAPYSEAVVADDFIYLAGQLGIVPGTRALAEGGIKAETRQTLDNLKAALERAGGSMDQVVKCTVFLADIADWAAMNEVYVTYFPNKPARSAVGNIGLGLDARVEIECIAFND